MNAALGSSICCDGGTRDGHSSVGRRSTHSSAQNPAADESVCQVFAEGLGVRSSSAVSGAKCPAGKHISAQHPLSSSGTPFFPSASTSLPNKGHIDEDALLPNGFFKENSTLSDKNDGCLLPSVADFIGDTSVIEERKNHVGALSSISPPLCDESIILVTETPLNTRMKETRYGTSKEVYQVKELLSSDNSLGLFLDSPLFSDLIITTDDANIPVHKVILAARYPKLIQSLVEMKRLALTGIPESVVRHWLRYLYTGDESALAGVPTEHAAIIFGRIESLTKDVGHGSTQVQDKDINRTKEVPITFHFAVEHENNVRRSGGPERLTEDKNHETPRTCKVGTRERRQGRCGTRARGHSLANVSDDLIGEPKIPVDFTAQDGRSLSASSLREGQEMCSSPRVPFSNSPGFSLTRNEEVETPLVTSTPDVEIPSRRRHTESVPSVTLLNVNSHTSRVDTLQQESPVLADAPFPCEDGRSQSYALNNSSVANWPAFTPTYGEHDLETQGVICSSDVTIGGPKPSSLGTNKSIYKVSCRGRRSSTPQISASEAFCESDIAGQLTTGPLVSNPTPTGSAQEIASTTGRAGGDELGDQSVGHSTSHSKCRNLFIDSPHAAVEVKHRKLYSGKHGRDERDINSDDIILLSDDSFSHVPIVSAYESTQQLIKTTNAPSCWASESLILHDTREIEMRQSTGNASVSAEIVASTNRESTSVPAEIVASMSIEPTYEGLNALNITAIPQRRSCSSTSLTPDKKQTSLCDVYGDSLWEGFDAAEFTQPEPIGQRIQVLQQSPCPATPVVRRRRGSHKAYVPSPFTPMPDYRAMSTPSLKRCMSRFGLKDTLSRKRMLLALEEIYKTTHQYETDTSADWTILATPSSSQKRKSPLPLRSSKKVKTVANAQCTKETTARSIHETEAEQHKKCAHDCGPISEIDKLLVDVEKFLCDSSADSESSSSGNADVTLMESGNNKESQLPGLVSDSDDTECDNEDTPGDADYKSGYDKESKDRELPTLTKEDVSSALRKFFLTDKVLYSALLRYEPIDYEDLKFKIKEAAINCTVSQLNDFCFEQCVPLSLKKTNRRGWGRKPTSKSRKGTKAFASQTANTAN